MSERNTDYNLLAEITDIPHDEWSRMSPLEQEEAIASIFLMEWLPDEWRLLSIDLQERIIDNSIDGLVGHSVEDIEGIIDDIEYLPKEYQDEILLNAPENADAVEWLSGVAQMFADHYGTVDREHIISIAKEEFEYELQENNHLYNAQPFDEFRYLQAKFKRFDRKAFYTALSSALSDSYNYPVDNWKVDRYSDKRSRELINFGVNDDFSKGLHLWERELRKKMGHTLMKVVIESVDDPYSGMTVEDYKGKYTITHPHNGPVWQVAVSPDWSLVEEELLNQLGEP